MSTHAQLNERDPLLAPAVHVATNGNDVLAGKQIHAQTLPGPLELSPTVRYGILAGIWTATFLSSLNLTLVPTMLPSISSEFNKSNQASWLGTSYLLATCTFTPLYGRLSDVLGRKRATHLALIFTAVGVLSCGFCKSMETLILARFLSGIGGGGLQTTSSIIISDMYTLRNRGLTQGIASVFNGLGMGLGGPFGGMITDWLGWRWAFILQLPLFVMSFFLTSYYLNYVTPGGGRSAAEILKRIDYWGIGTLFTSVGSILIFLSLRYNETLPWTNPYVRLTFSLSLIFPLCFIFAEIYIAREPMLAPGLLKQKIPLLVGVSNFLVALCNFSVIFFFPLWFQTVKMTNASTAGLHLVPNSVAMSLGSMFAGWMIHRTGRYKRLNATLGVFPFIGATLIARMHENSGPLQSWLSIIPLGFGNAVVLQTMLIALLAHLPDTQVAVGTGFGQLFRGIGQVGGVAVSSAVFQSLLDSELHRRIHTPDAEELILRIRQSAQLLEKLPPDIQRFARDAYAVSLERVFILAACSTLLAYVVRIPIPDRQLDHIPSRRQQNESPSRESVIEVIVEEEVEEGARDVLSVSKKNP